MKVLIQWATVIPLDYTEVNLDTVAKVRALPKKSEPNNSSVLDNAPGWVAAINIQGLVFAGDDHIGFEIVGSSLIVTTWNDDPDDFPVGTRWGKKWTLSNPAPDSKIGGKINTVQSVSWYGEPNSDPAVFNIPNLKPYGELVLPPPNQTLHGVWVSDAQWAALQNSRSIHGWREWVV